MGKARIGEQRRKEPLRNSRSGTSVRDMTSCFQYPHFPGVCSVTPTVPCTSNPVTFQYQEELTDSTLRRMLPTDYPCVSPKIAKGHPSHLAGSLSGFCTGSGAGCLPSFTVLEAAVSDFKAFLAIWEKKDVIRKRKSQNFINSLLSPQTYILNMQTCSLINLI